MAEYDINTPQYAEKITVEEYNKQKDEYTQKALKELQRQMLQQKVPNGKSITNAYADVDIDVGVDGTDNNDVCDDDNNSVIDYSDDEIADNQNQTNVNLIIKHVSMDNNSDKKNSNKKKPVRGNVNVSDKQVKTSMNDVIYAQHEIDTHKIQTMKGIISKLKVQIDEYARTTHYLKLDLNNAQCDNDDLKKNIIALKAENDTKSKQLETLYKQIYTDKLYLIFYLVIIMVLAVYNFSNN
jgi:hypothetical protein